MMAATDERNFRSTYYEKVGCRSVEEKKSLNILLKDKPLNRIKLKQFCLSFTVPTAQRSLLWNLLLGVLPVFPDSREFVMTQREAVFEDTLRAVRIMRYVNEKTPKSRVFFTMWILQNKKLHPDINIYEEHIFVDITEALLQVFENDVEIYWIAKEFYEFTIEINNDLPKLKELTFTLLEKEDTQLFNHLENHQILQNLPFEKWYTSCFANVISEPALMRIWDKICGGSRKIVVFLFLVLAKTLKMVLMRCTDTKQIVFHIEKKKEDQDDLIVNKAIDSWQNNKSHTEFMVHRKDN